MEKDLMIARLIQFDNLKKKDEKAMKKGIGKMGSKAVLRALWMRNVDPAEFSKKEQLTLAKDKLTQVQFDPLRPFGNPEEINTPTSVRVTKACKFASLVLVMTSTPYSTSFENLNVLFGLIFENGKSGYTFTKWLKDKNNQLTPDIFNLALELISKFYTRTQYLFDDYYEKLQSFFRDLLGSFDDNPIQFLDYFSKYMSEGKRQKDPDMDVFLSGDANRLLKDRVTSGEYLKLFATFIGFQDFKDVIHYYTPPAGGEDWPRMKRSWIQQVDIEHKNVAKDFKLVNRFDLTIGSEDEYEDVESIEYDITRLNFDDNLLSDAFSKMQIKKSVSISGQTVYQTGWDDTASNMKDHIANKWGWTYPYFIGIETPQMEKKLALGAPKQKGAKKVIDEEELTFQFHLPPRKNSGLLFTDSTHMPRNSEKSKKKGQESNANVPIVSPKLGTVLVDIAQLTLYNFMRAFMPKPNTTGADVSPFIEDVRRTGGFFDQKEDFKKKFTFNEANFKRYQSQKGQNSKPTKLNFSSYESSNKYLYNIRNELVRFAARFEWLHQNHYIQSQIQENGKTMTLLEYFIRCVFDVYFKTHSIDKGSENLPELIDDFFSFFSIESIFGSASDSQTESARETYNNGFALVLIFSKAAQTGVDLSGTNYLIIGDLQFTWLETKQTIGRGGRFKSHRDRPDELKFYRVIVPLMVRRQPEDGKVIRNYGNLTQKAMLDNMPTSDAILLTICDSRLIETEFIECVFRFWTENWNREHPVDIDEYNREDNEEKMNSLKSPHFGSGIISQTLQK
jgi:hypothetical protein